MSDPDQQASPDPRFQDEAWYRLMIDQVSDYAILALDPEGRVLTWNDGAQRIKGYQGPEIIGRNFTCFYLEEDRLAGKPERLLRAAAASGHACEEAWRVRKDGSRFWGSVTITPIHDGGGRLLGFSKITRDLTELKQAQDRVAALSQELELKYVEMEDTLYAASHDLRSPVLNIQGFSEELAAAIASTRERLSQADVPAPVLADLAPALAGRIPAALGYIQQGGRKLDALIQGLLRVSRAGRQPMAVQPVDMDQLLAQVAGAMAFQIGAADVSLEVGALPACAGDPQALDQVFSNLLDNALKYRRPDRPLRVRVAGAETAGRCIYTVEDDGIGILPQHQARVWKLFQRLDPRGVVPGEGLGLTLVVRLLNRLQGRAWVESPVSPEGTGCRFHVELPAP